MRTTPRQPRNAGVFDELAQRLHQMVRDVHANELPSVERFHVINVNPFRLAEVQGDLVLEDGDPDFTMGETLRARVSAGNVSNGHLVWVARNDQEWHAFDVVSR